MTSPDLFTIIIVYSSQNSIKKKQILRLFNIETERLKFINPDDAELKNEIKIFQ